MLEKTKILQNKNTSKFNFEEVLELQKVLEYHSNLYYNKNTSEISDKEYDELLKKLKKLEKKFSDVFVDKKIETKSDKIWAELIESSFKKVAHTRPMISLWNTYNEEDLEDFNERVFKNIWEEIDDLNYTLEFKFDWLWVELIYNNWILTQAITRGNWVEWEDVTQNIMQINNIPKKIDYLDYLEIRGEVVMPLSSFEKLNSEALELGEKVFSNPRNAASWSLGMKDNRVTKKRNLAFFAYDFWDLTISDSYFDCIKNLEKLWFNITSYFEKCENISVVIEKIHNFWDIKKNIDFEIDGLVLKVNNIDLWQKIWFTQHHPKYAIAYKFPAEILTTDILSVVHQVGRTWTITPVANLEPINIGWAIIKRATLHNYEECEKLQVWVGDSVFIKRAGEVIPKIIWVASPHPSLLLKEKEYVIPPKNCPSCNSEVLKDEEKVRYYCPNSDWCFEQKKHKLIYAVGKQWLNIDWFWKAQVETFLKLNIITDLYSIFKLKEKREEILELEWFQKKSVDNLLKAINDKKNINITTLLISLAISGVGKKTAQELSKLFTSEFELLHFNYSLEKIEELDDIWPEIAKNMQLFFTNSENKKLLKNLINILNIDFYKEKIIKNKNNIFYWKKVCITWSFWDIKRPDLIKKLEEVWWIFVTSVSKNTDFLVAGEKAGNKLKKAEELGIKVLNLEEFLGEL